MSDDGEPEVELNFVLDVGFHQIAESLIEVVEYRCRMLGIVADLHELLAERAIRHL